MTVWHGKTLTFSDNFFDNCYTYYDYYYNYNNNKKNDEDNDNNNSNNNSNNYNGNNFTWNSRTISHVTPQSYYRATDRSDKWRQQLWPTLQPSLKSTNNGDIILFTSLDDIYLFPIIQFAAIVIAICFL